MPAQDYRDSQHADTEKRPHPNRTSIARNSIQPAVIGAILTVATLFGGLIVGLSLGNIVFQALPGHNMDNPSVIHMAIASVPALAGFLLGGAAWGVAMGRIAAESDLRRMALAGLLGFAPITITLAIGLSMVETIASTGSLAQLPIHRLFTLLFVPASFLIAGTSAWAISRGLKENALARALFWQVGLVAAGTFLMINLSMEALGWVVGAPGAAERATMVTVLILGDVSAALAGGALIGYRLANR